MDIVTQSDIAEVLEELIIDYFSIVVNDSTIEALSAQLVNVWDTISSEELQVILEEELDSKLEPNDVFAFGEELYSRFI